MSTEQNSTFTGSIYDVYTEDSYEYKENRMPRVGQTAEFEDGRKFIFCSTSGALEPGLTVGAAAPVTATSVGTANIAGVTKISLTASGVIANKFRDGLLVLDESGHSYKIKSHTASGVANLVEVMLYDPLVAPMTAGDVVYVTVEVGRNVVVGDSINKIMGTPVVGTEAGGGFLWVQYQGLGPIKSAIVSGLGFMSSASGAVVAADGTKQTLGAVVDSTGDNMGLAYWNILGSL